jgi:hypothetical protein
MQAAAAVVKGEPEFLVTKVIAELSKRLSSKAKLLTEEGEEWSLLMERWTDLGKESPGAIVHVATEADVLETVSLQPYHM